MQTADPDPHGRLANTLEFARLLQNIDTIPGLVAATQSEVRQRLGYSAAWVSVFEDKSLEMCRLWSVSGDSVDPDEAVGLVFSARDDKMIAEIVETQRIVVIEDARTDPRTDKRMVEAFQNRTLIQVPLRLLEQPLGVLGLGSFGDEGVLPPSEEDLGLLLQIAGYLSVALSRVQMRQQQQAREAERLKHERMLARVQRLESVGLMAGGIAHDFKNLLAVILANAALIERRGLTDAQERNMRSLIDATERAAELCSRVLALGRKNELRLQTLSLGDRVSSLLHLIREVMPDVEVDLRIGEGLSPVRADAGQIDQVVTNLCLNARDAMPNGGRLRLETHEVELSVEALRTHPWARPGRYVVLAVSDTGSGMSEEMVEHIFEPFFTTKEAGTGTGLGLAVAYSIMRQHEGMLQCYSEVGTGTTFKLYLPASQGEGLLPVPQEKDCPPGRGQSVLVAEDEEAVRELVRHQLESAGYRVLTVENGQEAVREVEQTPFDVVLLDVMMPVMGGREAWARIRRIRPETRFVFASGYTSKIGRAELLEATQAELVPKPYHDDTLLHAVHRALSGSASKA